MTTDHKDGGAAFPQSEAMKALTYVKDLLAKADPELFECACKGGHASELLPVDIGEMIGVSNALRAALEKKP